MWELSKYAKENVVYDTMIVDERGKRNKCRLKKIGNLWFVPDGSFYVYYTPTHIKEI